MKKIKSILLLIFLSVPNISAYQEIYGPIKDTEKQVLTISGKNTCTNIKESDIPTIFIPGILASWYSKESYNNTDIKRWIPDPITHSYDTLFYTFKENGYSLKDVFYKDEFNTYIDGNPKHSLYLFGYDWKKDNKITAKLLSNLISQIRVKYKAENGCDIGNVNIIAHSMGGLIARAMLEDMCASEKYMNEKSFYDRTGLQKGQLKEFKSSNCNNLTKINKLITISTPHRGSPRSFPMWEKGNIEEVEDTLTSLGLKSQLTNKNVFNIFDYSFDEQLYDRFHGMDSNIPNGIVTIGQLLPDIKNNNNYNDSLKYLYKNGYLDNRNNYIYDAKKNYLNNNEYPKNSFLEELNKEENINKIFKNIKNKYISYYSKQTGNFSKNNIVEFSLDPYYLEGNNEYYKKKTNSISNDIYSIYNNDIPKNYFNIDKIIRNQDGLGGDGTVPTKNLMLVPNDSYSGKEVKNNKFESKEMKCYVGEKPNTLFSEIDEYKENLYLGLGNDADLEICSHTKTSMGLAVKVFDEISGNNIFKNLKPEIKIQKERSLLLQYIGNTNYIAHDYKGIASNSETIYNFTNLSNYFIKDKNSDNVGYGYHPVLKDKEMQKELTKVENNTFNKTSISLDFGGKSGKLIRYEVLSPINLIIEDEQGRKIGIDPDTGMIINEIPGAWTSGDTEGTNEPEFFLIPYTGTGNINQKITSYPTGNGEYHIVIKDFKENIDGNIIENKELIIPGIAKKGIIEDIEVDINGGKGTYIKTNLDNFEKYSEILEKIYKIIDEKYNQKQKEKLKNNLEKFINKGNNNISDKLYYLVQKVFNYLNK